MNGSLRLRGGTYILVFDLPRRPDGTRNQKQITLEKISKRAAQERRRQILSEVDGGTFVPDSRLTVAELLNKWLDHCRPTLTSQTTVSPKTHQEYSRIVRLHLEPHLGSVRVGKLRADHVAQVYTELRESGLSGQTCLSIHRVLHRGLNYAKKTLRAVKRNVSDDVDAPKPASTARREFHVSEVVAILEAAKGNPMEVPILVGAFTGLRRGEVMALRWSAIDFEEGTLSVREAAELTKEFGLRYKAPKSRTSQREVPLHSSLLRRSRLTRRARTRDARFLAPRTRTTT